MPRSHELSHVKLFVLFISSLIFLTAHAHLLFADDLTVSQLKKLESDLSALNGSLDRISNQQLQLIQEIKNMKIWVRRRP